MYNQFFGLAKDAFNLTPDPEFLYLTAHHKEALAGFTYAILARKGFVILTGDAGTGKTTLVTQVLRLLPATRVQISIIVNPTLTPGEFLEAALLGFGLQDVPASKAQRLAKLQNLLSTGRSAGRVSALIIDEAHKLSTEVLEEIRLLGNFESAEEKLLQIALIGQSELDVLLNRDSMRQFKQRIALRMSVEALAGRDVEQYIRYRWAKGGGGEAPFSNEALTLIGAVSKGIPRVINVICDNALMQAFGEGSRLVDIGHVRGACRDLCLSQPTASEQPATQGIAAMAPDQLVRPLDISAMRTLERYNTASTHPSLLARLAGKLGVHQRIETA